MSVFYFIIFLLIALSLYFGLNYYVYNRISKWLALSSKVSLYLKMLFLIGALSFILGEIINRSFNSHFILYFGVIWFGLIPIAFSLFILKDIAGLIFNINQKAITMVVIILSLLITGFSVYNNSRSPRIKNISMPIMKPHKNLSGFTIVQLSDLHLDPLKSSGWLKSVVNETNKLNPDLIVITGDLIDEDISQIDDFVNTLKRLKAKYGVVTITGNHEVYTGIDTFLRITDELQITVLRDSKTTIANAIELIGIDNNRAPNQEEKLKGLIKSCDPNKAIITLCHRPLNFDERSKLGVDLQLSGHTHVGQIPPMDLIIMLYYKYPYGLYKKNSSYIYTTSGTGFWGPPMRLFSRSEIVKIILE